MNDDPWNCALNHSRNARKLIESHFFSDYTWDNTKNICLLRLSEKWKNMRGSGDDEYYQCSNDNYQRSKYIA